MEIFSPIQQITINPNLDLWVKRDDLIDPYISGNKWRKLKYAIEHAQLQQKTHLVTFGGAYSNHLLATAAAAARAKLTSTGFVRGEQVNNQILTLCRLFGMNLIFTDRESYRQKQQLFETYFAHDPSTYFIDEGGASPEAVKGCTEILHDLPQHFHHVCCAAGTGTTAAGLLRSINQQQLNTKLHVVPALKGGEFITTEIEKYEPKLDQLVLHTSYHFGGYAKTTPELIAFTKRFISSTGMLIDPIYTAKLFFAINDLANNNYFQPGERILAIHTGGLMGILGMQDKFYSTWFYKKQV